MTSVAHTASTVYVAVLGLLLLPWGIGTTLRLFLEQSAWVAGLFITANKPDEWVVVVHLLAMACVGLLLWMWRRPDQHLRRAFLFAGLTSLMIAPLGLVPGALYLWQSRRPDLLQEIETTPALVGKPRRRLVGQMLGSFVVLTILAVPVFTMFQSLPLAWIPAATLIGLLPALPLWRAMMPPKPGQEQALHIMPPLPDMSQR